MDKRPFGKTGIRVPKSALQMTLGGIFLAAAVAVLIYYIQGPSLGVIHSDCTDSLLWSQVMLDSGHILSEDFRYAAILPFGSSLWTVPILAICGYSVTAYILSMSVFAVLFALAAWSLFRALGWDPLSSGFSTFCTCLLLSGSEKLREIMWQHTIYYSLGLLLVMLILNLAIRTIRAWECLPDTSRARKWTMTLVWGGLLFLLTMGAATDGFQILSVSAVPVAGALLLQTWFDRRSLLSRRARHHYAVIGVLAIASVLGLWLLNVLTGDGEITAGYENAYSVWTDMGRWWDNATQFLPHYLSLFGVRIRDGEQLFSVDSLNQIIKMGIGLVVLILPVIGLCRIGKMERRARLLLWTYLLVSGVTLFGFICGALANANWRLTPFLGVSVLASLVTVKDLLGREIVWRRLGAAACAALLFGSLIFARTMVYTPTRYTVETRPETRVIELLKEKGYTDGYATFWNSHILTLLSDGEIQMLTLGTVSPETPYLYENKYQHNESDFAKRIEENGPCFLLLTAYEFETAKNGGGFSEISQRETVLDSFSVGDYRVIVLENNPFT